MKKIFTITESEREAILSKHTEYKNSLLKEQETQTATKTTTTVQPAATTEPRFKTATCAGLQKGPKCVDNALKLQIKINDTCPSNVLTAKLIEDGVVGTNTRKALALCDSYVKVVQKPSGPGVPPGAEGTLASSQGGTQGTPSGSSSAEQFDSLTV